MLDDIAIVDVETTGTGPIWDRVIEIGIIRVQNGEVIDQINTLINPETYIPTFIQNFTGITREMVEEAPRFQDLA